MPSLKYHWILVWWKQKEIIVSLGEESVYMDCVLVGLFTGNVWNELVSFFKRVTSTMGHAKSSCRCIPSFPTLLFLVCRQHLFFFFFFVVFYLVGRATAPISYKDESLNENSTIMTSTLLITPPKGPTSKHHHIRDWHSIYASGEAQILSPLW